MPSNRTLRIYDHRLIQLVQETGDAELATRLGVPKSTASGWIRRSPRAVITASGLDESAVALRIRVARLEKRVCRLGAMVRILLALFRILQPDLSRSACEVCPAGTRCVAETENPLWRQAR